MKIYLVDNKTNIARILMGPYVLSNVKTNLHKNEMGLHVVDDKMDPFYSATYGIHSKIERK